MKMHQIVYVVADTDQETVLGVYNKAEDAYHVIKDRKCGDVSITPVLVDAAPDEYRYVHYDTEEMEKAVQEEIDLAKEIEEEEAEDEDEYEDEEDEYYAGLYDFKWDDDDGEFDDDDDDDEDEDDDDEFELTDKGNILAALLAKGNFDWDMALEMVNQIFE